MFRHGLLRLGLLTAVLVSSGKVYAQEMYYLSARLDEKLDTAKQGARDLIERLAAYPADARDAALKLAQYPGLIVRLRAGGTIPAQYAPGQSGTYPPEVTAAATRLASYPDLLNLMEQRLLSVSLLGEVCREQEPMVRAIVSHMSERIEAVQTAAHTAWTRRLVQTPVAAQQLMDARADYAKLTGNQAPVTEGLPPPVLVQFILTAADRYPELASEIIDQWEQERNPEPFRAAVDYWYAQRRDILPDDTRNQPELRKRALKEQAQFEQHYKEAVQKGDPMAATRAMYVQAHLQDYPGLVRVREMKLYAIAMASQPERMSGAPWTSKGGGSGSRSSGSSSSRSSTSSPRTSTSSSSGRNSSGQNGSGGGGFFGNSNNSRNGGSGGSGFGSNRGGSSGGFGGGSSGGFGGGSSGSGFGSSGGSNRFGG